MYQITLMSLDFSAQYVRDAVFADIPFLDVMSRHGVTLKICNERLEKHLVEDEAEYDAIVTPGNSFGHMTGGFDGALVNVFGQELDERVRAHIEMAWCGELPVGNARLIELTANPHASWIVYTPTMRVPHRLPDNSEAPYIATLAAFQRIRRWNHNKPKSHNSIVNVLLPVMGMGTGGLNRDYVARQMQLALIRAVECRSVKELGADGFRWDLAVTTQPQVPFNGGNL